MERSSTTGSGIQQIANCSWEHPEISIPPRMDRLCAAGFLYPNIHLAVRPWLHRLARARQPRSASDIAYREKPCPIGCSCAAPAMRRSCRSACCRHCVLPVRSAKRSRARQAVAFPDGTAPSHEMCIRDRLCSCFCCD